MGLIGLPPAYIAEIQPLVVARYEGLLPNPEQILTDRSCCSSSHSAITSSAVHTTGRATKAPRARPLQPLTSTAKPQVVSSWIKQRLSAVRAKQHKRSCELEGQRATSEDNLEGGEATALKCQRGEEQEEGR
eukprot:366782-Hanusia_phi.AAC.4